MAEIEHDPALAAPAEVIHMPEPSYMPFALAIFATVTLVGVITSLPVMIIGLVGVVAVLTRWIRTTRAEMSELPLDHSAH
jgi:hypothetical protein